MSHQLHAMVLPITCERFLFSFIRGENMQINVELYTAHETSVDDGFVTFRLCSNPWDLQPFDHLMWIIWVLCKMQWHNLNTGHAWIAHNRVNFRPKEDWAQNNRIFQHILLAVALPMDMGINPFDCPKIVDSTEMCVIFKWSEQMYNIQCCAVGVLFKECKFN